MLKLSSQQIRALCEQDCQPDILRLTKNAYLPRPLRANHVLLIDQTVEPLPDGFHSYFTFRDATPSFEHGRLARNCFFLAEELNYLQDGDVVKFNPINPSVRAIYRRNSRHNSLLVTERCNNFCLMCSQPPRDIDDSYIIEELFKAIPLMDRETREIGITGGEPTLLGDSFVDLLWSCKNNLPVASLHVLSNGRNFAYGNLAKKVASVGHHDLMIGIPLYSDISNIHDYVVQADGAFDETIKGILNLKRYRQKVEVRVVIHKQTYDRLPQLAQFLARNLLFVDHVALMGLEMMGFTKPNIGDLWIDPVDYQPQLVEAVQILTRFKMKTSIYNHQLCILDRRLWSFNVKSISDWKNEFMPECADCSQQTQCGGFFSSSKFKYSASISAIKSSGA